MTINDLIIALQAEAAIVGGDKEVLIKTSTQVSDYDIEVSTWGVDDVVGKSVYGDGALIRAN